MNNLREITTVSDLEHFFKSEMRKYVKDFTIFNEKIYMPANKALHISISLMIEEKLFWYSLGCNQEFSLYETLAR